MLAYFFSDEPNLAKKNCLCERALTIIRINVTCWVICIVGSLKDIHEPHHEKTCF